MRGRELEIRVFSGLCTLVVVSIVISTATSTCAKGFGHSASGMHLVIAKVKQPRSSRA